MAVTLSRNLHLEETLVPWWDETVEARPRLTKIVCTIGPNTNKVEVLEEMIRTGMNIARLNFSHGDHNYHQSVIDNVRKAAQNTGMRVALMLDTKGPEIRTGKVKGGSIELKAGDKITVTNDNTIEGTEKMISLDYPRFPKAVKKGGTILIADGNLGFTIQNINEDGKTVECTVNNNFTLGSTKNVHLPGATIDLPAVSDKDVDYCAASFIRTANDVHEIRGLLGNEGANIRIISKIESTEGLENFNSILEASDGIMVARGDLGVELPMEQIFAAQKMMVSKCNAVAKPVITATQMLESMIENPRPTRAEATDVANAVLDGTDAVMLSGETASGKWPIQAISYMSKLCISAERVESASYYPSLFEAIRDHTPVKAQVSEVVSSYAVRAANDLDAKLIITITETGSTAKQVAKYRPRVPVLAITSTEDAAFSLCASRSVYPIVVPEMLVTEKMVELGIKTAKSKNMVKTGDLIVVITGVLQRNPGKTNRLTVVNA